MLFFKIKPIPNLNIEVIFYSTFLKHKYVFKIKRQRVHDKLKLLKVVFCKAPENIEMTRVIYLPNQLVVKVATQA
jgi:hypothetical protein